ncbi:MAG: hypothetical protein KIS83_07775 [Rubrivivax sp.]|nr:hypothetical protein [Rubrivivax sp.]
MNNIVFDRELLAVERLELNLRLRACKTVMYSRGGVISDERPTEQDYSNFVVAPDVDNMIGVRRVQGERLDLDLMTNSQAVLDCLSITAVKKAELAAL